MDEMVCMKKFCNSEWLRALRLIPNSAILCYHSPNLYYQCKFRGGFGGGGGCVAWGTHAPFR